MARDQSLPEPVGGGPPPPRLRSAHARRPSARAARRLERRHARRERREAAPRIERVARRVLASAAVLSALGLAALLGVQAFLAYELDQLRNFSSGPGTEAAGAPLSLPEPAGEVETFLIFSAGSAGLTPAEAKRLGVVGLKERGEDNLTDVLMLVVVDPRAPSARVLSIPRDTFLPERGYRINSVFRREGAQALTEEVHALTGVPVNHLISMDFKGFATITDEVGGVDMYVPQPTRDTFSGLFLPDAGCTHFDGRSALAFVRSRHTEIRDRGRWRTAASASDFGRIQRQQVFISAMLDKLLGPELPLRIPALLRVAKRDVVIDDELSVDDLVSLARAFTSSTPDAVRYFSLPATPDRVRGAEVVRVDRKAAVEVLNAMREGVPGAEALIPVKAPRTSTAPESPPASSQPARGEDGAALPVPPPPAPSPRGYAPC